MVLQRVSDKKLMEKKEKIIFFIICIALSIGLAMSIRKTKQDLASKPKDLLSKEDKKLIKKKIFKSVQKSRSPSQAQAIVRPKVNKKQLLRQMQSPNTKSLKYRSLATSNAPAFTNYNGKSYKLLNDFVAIRKTKENIDLYKGATQKLGHYIVPKDLATNNSFPVVENTQSSRLGIVTGIITLKVKDLSQVNYLLNHTNFEIKNTYEHINVIHMQFYDYETLINSYEFLKTSPNVIRSNIEILEYERVQN